MKRKLDTPVAHFFFSSNFSNRDDPYLALGSWVVQIVSDHPPAFEIAYSTWLEQNHRHATQSTILEILRGISQLAPGCTFVLDGLDECTWWSGGSTISSVTSLLGDTVSAISGSECRLLLVSRDEPEIQNVIGTSKGWFQLGITHEDVKSDAIVYSRSIVEKKLGNKDETLRQELSQRMVNRCNGQFLWLKLQEDSLRSWKNKKKLEDTIDETPSGLDRLYSRNVARILGRPERERNRALRLIRWAAFAFRPLSVQEIAEAVLIDHELDNLPVDDLPELVDKDYIATEIIDLCGSLVEVRPDDKEGFAGRSTVHPTHLSIKEYFIRYHRVFTELHPSSITATIATKIDENLVLARLCLRYINYPHAWAKDKRDGRGHRKGFLKKYAAQSWFRHASHSNCGDPGTLRLMETLFDSQNPQRDAWKTWFSPPGGTACPWYFTLGTDSLINTKHRFSMQRN